MKTLLPSQPLPENATNDTGIHASWKNGFSVRSRLNSFVFAGRGIFRFFKYEPNARLHLAATLAVVILCFYLSVSKSEVLVLVLCIALVWLTEMVNTAIEKAMDFITLEKHPDIGKIKDMAAGAVLVAALCALVAGLIIFIPKLHLP